MSEVIEGFIILVLVFAGIGAWADETKRTHEINMMYDTDYADKWLEEHKYDEYDDYLG